MSLSAEALSSDQDPAAFAARLERVVLLGNPNTGKTTLFNRLCGLRHKTSNFPGTTQEARIGFFQSDDQHAIELIDLPGIYSLELNQSESLICRQVLAGELMPRGEKSVAPDAVLVIVDGTNLARNLMLVGEALRRRLPTVVAVNMIDLARRQGLAIDPVKLGERIGCEVVPCSARTGEGIERVRAALGRARIPNHTPGGSQEALEAWADEAYAVAASGEPGRDDRLTDHLDRAFTHPVLGVMAFVLIMAGLFWVIFKLAQVPMDMIDWMFVELGGLVERTVPPGLLQDLLANGIVGGVGATVIFLPQICLLFFLISLLEDTGYLARAAFVMDRVLRPFGLPGHSFVPLLSSHACALPGIMAARAVPDRRERLATILVAPFMTCSARLPVYVLLISLLFHERPFWGAVAFVGCYALGAFAGLFSALLARKTILRGQSRPMALELPSYKMPSFRTALMTTFDRAMIFLKKAGTAILAICIVLWWLGSYPLVDPPQEAVELRERAAALQDSGLIAASLEEQADQIEAAHAQRNSFIGRIGRAVEPVFAPLGYDWQLSIGVISSFAAREVFVSTMAIVVSGSEDTEDEGVIAAIAEAKRDDGETPVFTHAAAWSLLVYYVLAMQCLPTLAVTAKESGSWKWAALQLVWMCGLAYVLAWITFVIAS